MIFASNRQHPHPQITPSCWASRPQSDCKNTAKLKKDGVNNQRKSVKALLFIAKAEHHTFRPMHDSCKK
jgi:hypothetical protein